MSEPQPPRAIGILGYGAMGAGVAWSLAKAGFDVATCVSGRSEATRARALENGVMCCDTLPELVARSDTFLSLVPADQAEMLAASVAQCLARRETPLHYVDCNSITPKKAGYVAEAVTRWGAIYTDAGIIGPPPAEGRDDTLLYVSGPHRAVLEALETPEMPVRLLGDSPTQATEMKVLFASINKGAVALLLNVMAAAERVGLLDEVARTADEMKPGLLDLARGQARGVTAKAARWAIEMEDLSAGLNQIGVDGGYHAAAATSYRRLARNLAEERPVTADDDALARILAAWPRRD